MCEALGFKLPSKNDRIEIAAMLSNRRGDQATVGMKLPKLRYVCVDDWVTQQARGRSVLHLGCAGDYLEYGPARCLHGRIVGVAHCTWGVEIDPERLAKVRQWFPGDSEGRVRYLCGDVTRLQDLSINQSFEVILVGAIIEHLPNPGDMLEGIANLCGPDTRVIITTPHVFGFLQFVRVALRRVEAVNPRHTCWFSIQTLTELCSRYRLEPTAWLTGYGWQPPSLRWSFQKMLGVPFFRFFPHVGGSLVGEFRLRAEGA